MLSAKEIYKKAQYIKQIKASDLVDTLFSTACPQPQTLPALSRQNTREGRNGLNRKEDLQRHRCGGRNNAAGVLRGQKKKSTTVRNRGFVERRIRRKLAPWFPLSGFNSNLEEQATCAVQLWPGRAGWSTKVRSSRALSTNSETHVLS